MWDIKSIIPNTTNLTPLVLSEHVGYKATRAKTTTRVKQKELVAITTSSF